jgi:hypothetical protein
MSTGKTITTTDGRKLVIPPERRVRFVAYGPIDRDDPRLVNIPSSGPQQRLHWFAAEQLRKLIAHAKRDGFNVKIASGWRPQLWPTEAAYNAAMIAQYGSVAEGRLWRAFESSHMTGLVVDFGTEGLRPTKATIKAQQASPFFAWLVANAGKYGFTNYHREPWHWEIVVPISTFHAGQSSLARKIAVAVGGVAVIAGAAALIKKLFR